MNRIDGKYLYLGILFLFKLAVGGILLITSWDSLTLSENYLLNICLLMTLSFLPATFSRPLFQKIKYLGLKRQISINFILVSGLLGVEYFLFVIKSPALFLVNFLLWIGIFLIEVILEKWFVDLSSYFSLDEARRLSGISTTAGQVGLVLGPLLMIIMKKYSFSLPYLFCMLSFFIPWVVLIVFKKFPQMDIPVEKKQYSKRNPSIMYTMALSLIWPTIAIFNIAAPMIAKNQFDSINVVGVMEFLISSSMALIGFFHITTMSHMNHFKRIIMVLFMLFSSSILIYLYSNSLMTIFISTFVIGLSFGYLRIELRAFLSQKFSSEEAGEIIARANTWSGILVLVYCLLYYLESLFRNSHGISIVFPLSFILGGCVICILLLNEPHVERERV